MNVHDNKLAEGRGFIYVCTGLVVFAAAVKELNVGHINTMRRWGIFYTFALELQESASSLVRLSVIKEYHIMDTFMNDSRFLRQGSRNIDKCIFTCIIASCIHASCLYASCVMHHANIHVLESACKFVKKYQLHCRYHTYMHASEQSKY